MIKGDEEFARGGSGRLEWVLFAFALAVYAGTRFVGLGRFPPFFFCDEALQGNLAEYLRQNHFKDQTGTFLPPYFLNDARWAVSLSVYIHVLPVWIFGKSVEVLRGTSAAVALFGAAATGLAWRWVAPRVWWCGPLVLAALPVEFVHARLGFESVMSMAFFAGFLWMYFLYRLRSRRYLFGALLLGAATFYAYTAGQGMMFLTGIALLVADFSYHRRQPIRFWIAAALLAAVLATPYVRYRRLHPGVVHQQLEILQSYWLFPTPLQTKLKEFGSRWTAAYRPAYWFVPNEKEAERHRVSGEPFFPIWLAPFAALGAGVCVWKFRRSPAHRAVLLTLPGIPFAASIVDLQILRLLGMVVPFAFLVGIGLDALAGLLRGPTARAAGTAALAGGLTFASGRLAAKALLHGQTAFTNYGLYGLQWGAPQVFSAVRQELAASSKARVLVSPVWANNPGEFVTFFLSPEEQERGGLGHVDDLYPMPLDGIWVLTPEEYASLRSNPKFVLESPTRIVRYPDGRPGFYFVRLHYSEKAPEIFAAESEERRRPVRGEVLLDGEQVEVVHSQTDMGSLEALFDRRPETVLRGLEANPFVLDFRFPSPRRIAGVVVRLGAMSVELTATVQTAGGGTRSWKQEWKNPAPDYRVELDFPEPLEAAALRLEIKSPNEGVPTHIHVFELEFLPPATTRRSP